jgi:hypothetical protein
MRNEREAHATLSACNDCECSSWAITKAQGKCPRREPVVSPPMPQIEEDGSDPRLARWLAVAFVVVVWAGGIAWSLS